MSYQVAFADQYEEKPITDCVREQFEKMLAADSKMVYLDADLMAGLGTLPLREKYPERVINCGIQEANMIGVGSGLAALDFKVYTHSFAAFITRRAFDQIFISVAYSKGSMHIIGSEPGIRQDYNGGTHMTFEDVAMMRTISDCHIFDVTDNAMLIDLLEQTKDLSGIFYYRLPLNEVKQVYQENSAFEIGKGNVLQEGKDATIIATGLLVPEALKAAELLAEENLYVEVIDMFTIKPLDEKLIIESAKKTGAIVTAENASRYGGLGEGVNSVLANHYPTLTKNMAVKDEFGEVGPESYLQERFGFTAQRIAEQVKVLLKEKM